eukprot:m.63750 g.63750  ORF g.63750 m.63750 type:complete len:419 (+) comp7214_c0_seq1:102-1358(+)
MPLIDQATETAATRVHSPVLPLMPHVLHAPRLPAGADPRDHTREVVLDDLGDGLARVLRGDVLACTAPSRDGHRTVLVDVAHDLGEACGAQGGPLVPLLVVDDLRQVRKRGLEASRRHQEGCAVRHELGLPGPGRGDRRQTHRHRLHQRAAPTLCVRCKDECICCAVQLQILAHGHLGKEHDLWRVGDLETEQKHVVVVLWIAACMAAGADVQCNVVACSERRQVRREQDVPALALLPLEDAEKGKPAFTTGQDGPVSRHEVWVELRGVNGLWNDKDVLTAEACGNKPVGPPCAGHPDLVHGLHRPLPRRRDQRCLEHGAADAVVEVLEAVPCCIPGVRPGVILREIDVHHVRVLLAELLPTLPQGGQARLVQHWQLRDVGIHVATDKRKVGQPAGQRHEEVHRLACDARPRMQRRIP